MASSVISLSDCTDKKGMNTGSGSRQKLQGQ